MAKKYLPKVLKFPIEFYRPKHIFAIFIVVFTAVLAIMIYDSIFSLAKNGVGLSLAFKLIGILFSIVMIVLFLKAFTQSKPIFRFETDKVIINQLLAKQVTVYYKEIKAIHFSHGRHARLGFERFDKNAFTKSDVVPIEFLKVDKVAVNSRQVENIVNQIFENFKNNAEKPIYLNSIKRKFFDGT